MTNHHTTAGATATVVKQNYKQQKNKET